MEPKDTSLTSQGQLPIDQINLTLKELGSTAKWKRAPEKIKGTEVLKDRTIVMVDDEQDILEAFAPDLIVATDSKAFFIKYTGQSIEELIERIGQTGANVVLLDYHLSETLKGSRVTRALFDAGFSGSVVGFSSDSGIREDFQQAGALGSVSKEAWSPEFSVIKLAELLKKGVAPGVDR